MSRSVTKRPRSAQRRALQRLPKPQGMLDHRVQAVGPDHFGIVAVDCAKLRSRWALRNFYGTELLLPATVEHTAPGFRQAVDVLRGAVAQHRLAHVLIAIERTGDYHRPVQRAFRDAGFETRIVHPFASSQFRKVEHPGDKT